MSQKIKNQIEGLRDQIRHHDHQYYALNMPDISDQDYDHLFAQLRKLEDDHPEYASPESPTQRVSGEPLDGFTSVEHSLPMLSIDNTYSAEDLRLFDQRVKKIIEDHPFQYVVEPKIDGVAASLRYENGLLTLATTRGDGKVGDDVTNNVRTIASVPLKLSQINKAPEVLEIRGEIFMPNAVFNQINKDRSDAGEAAFANPRNATAGSLKMLDHRIVAQRKLQFIGYALGLVEPAGFSQSHDETLKKLKSHSLPVHQEYGVVNDIEEVIDLCNQWDKKKNDLGYMIDGMVIKVNDVSLQQQLGMTARAPRWCIAYKFPAERVETKVESIDVQVGKTGALTPVVNLIPVLLAGTTVKRASLHNFEELERKDVRIGDVVTIEKSGEIIPQVVEVLLGKRPGGTKSFSVPTECPACGGQVQKDQQGVSVRCLNPQCQAKMIEQLKHFAGRNQMDIDGLGESIIEQLVQEKLVMTIPDLYRLSQEQVESLERMGEKSSRNLIDSIQVSKERPLANVLSGLGILHVGAKVAEIIAEHFGRIDSIMKADIETLEAIDEVGPVIAKSLYDFCRDTEKRNILEQLIELGLKMPGPDKTAPKSNVLDGKTIVVTGTLEGLSRKDIEQLVKQHGGKPSSSVSKKTSFVVAGENPGSKVEKAKSLGVEILSGKEFIDLIS